MNTYYFTSSNELTGEETTKYIDGVTYEHALMQLGSDEDDTEEEHYSPWSQIDSGEYKDGQHCSRTVDTDDIYMRLAAAGAQIG